VTGARLTRLSKKLFAHLLEIAEADIGRFAPHLVENLCGRRHGAMVSIVAPLFKLRCDPTDPSLTRQMLVEFSSID
jgi:hypothetical protein